MNALFPGYLTEREESVCLLVLGGWWSAVFPLLSQRGRRICTSVYFLMCTIDGGHALYCPVNDV